jgi:transcriptional regulator with XRE-family HTH domain
MARPDKPQHARKTGQSRFAEIWRELRRGMGMNQRQLADKLGCSGPHVSNIEQGRRLPTYELVSRLEDLAGSEGLLRSHWEWAYTERAASATAPAAPPIGHQIPGDRVEFVRDMTIGDGLFVATNETFTKVWRIRNVGSVAWVDRTLRRAGPSTPRFGPSSPVEVPIPPTDIGRTVDLQVGMRAPALPGDCIAFFYMAHPDGRLCFPDRYANGVYVRISVREPVSLAALT